MKKIFPRNYLSSFKHIFWKILIPNYFENFDIHFWSYVQNKINLEIIFFKITNCRLIYQFVPKSCVSKMKNFFWKQYLVTVCCAIDIEITFEILSNNIKSYIPGKQLNSKQFSQICKQSCILSWMSWKDLSSFRNSSLLPSFP